METLFSPFLISVGQTAAILTYLHEEDHDTFLEEKRRWILVSVFFILQLFLQALQHHFAVTYGMGSLPTLPFLFAGWLLYALFLSFWSKAPWPCCCFVAFVLLLVDSCIWPLVSSASRMLWGLNYLYEGSYLLRLPFILALGLLECLLAYSIHKLLPKLEKLQLNRYDAILALAIIVPFLYFRNQAGQEYSQDNKSAQIMITSCCLVAVITLAAEVGHASEAYEKQKEEEIQTVLRQQQAMYQQKLQNMDLINRKYHDMKNALLYLQSSGHKATATSVSEMLNSISPFEHSIVTGNEVIDVILSEKLSTCTAESILCVPCLDGKMFDFVQPLDLCTIFGNSMDNAIESCRAIRDPALRHISLHSTRKGETVIFTVRNTFERAPDLDHGMPATTKADRNNHGFGLRNMQYVADSYSGFISCRIENEEFVLTVLLNEHN